MKSFDHIKGEEAKKQSEELLSLMIQLDRDWYPDDDLELSQNRVVKQLKSLDTSKYLGRKILYFIVKKIIFHFS